MPCMLRLHMPCTLREHMFDVTVTTYVARLAKCLAALKVKKCDDVAANQISSKVETL